MVSLLRFTPWNGDSRFLEFQLGRCILLFPTARSLQGNWCQHWHVEVLVPRALCRCKEWNVFWGVIQLRGRRRRRPSLNWLSFVQLFQFIFVSQRRFWYLCIIRCGFPIQTQSKNDIYRGNFKSLGLPLGLLWCRVNGGKWQIGRNLQDSSSGYTCIEMINQSFCKGPGKILSIVG